MIRNRLKSLLQKITGAPEEKIVIEIPPRPAYGDYATNLPLVLARERKASPLQVAEEIAGVFNEGFVKRVQVEPPGFLNFFLSDAALLETAESILRSPDEYGNQARKPEKVLCEYFQLNTAKPAHIGHARSALIGDALKRIFSALGYETVSDTHIGDWGTQFGILLYAYKNFGERGEIEKDPLNELNNLYVAMNKKIEADKSLYDLAKEEFAKLEKGNEENRKIWEWMSEISMQKFLETAERLRLLPFEYHFGESAYESETPPIVNELLEKNIAKRDEAGAVIVDLEKEGMGDAVILKSDGATTYLLRDLATLKRRIQSLGIGLNLYVVDVRQTLNFRQLFRIAELLGWGGARNIHVSYGFIRLPEGMMSTRKGNVRLLDDVIDEIISEAGKIIEAKNPDLRGKAAVAEAVGLGALKYFVLSHARNSEITFRMAEALSFEGDTGPYLQYTYARFRSILRKAKSESIGRVSAPEKLPEAERTLALEFIRFPDALEDAVKEYDPHILASYLYALAQKANSFYHANPVLPEKDPALRALRLFLVEAASGILKRGLALLGIEAPEEM